MLTFDYVAKDNKSGQEIKAQIQADTEQSAANLLLKQGLTPLKLEVVGTRKGFLNLKGRISTKDKVLFSRQLSTLINAGLPLTQSLRSVVEQTQSDAFKVVVNQIIIDVEGGTTFSKALEKFPKVFDTVFTSLVAAGEVSGTLGESLERLAAQQEKDAEIRSKVKGALVYPAIVLLVIAGVIIFMLTSVLPQVELLYEDLNQALPFITAVLLSISKFITGFWWLIILLLLAAGFFGKRYSETTEGHRMVDRLKMSVPVFGKLFRKMYMARFCRTGQTLMAAGVPMLEMLRITGVSVNNIIVEEAVGRASQKVQGGTALSESLAKEETVFLSLVPQMIKIGEDSGAMDAMMDRAASFYETEIDNEVKTISTTIEPILMVVLAAVAALLVGAILLPVYGLVGNSLV
jgi:type IV pilus assembly protein PilC